MHVENFAYNLKGPTVSLSTELPGKSKGPIKAPDKFVPKVFFTQVCEDKACFLHCCISACCIVPNT